MKNNHTIQSATLDALKCRTRKQFQEEYGSAFWFAKKNEVMDIVCAHIPIIRRWNKKDAFTEALKYNTRIEMKNADRGLSAFLYQNEYITDACTHMTKLVKQPIWTYDKLQELVSSLSTIPELKETSLSAYQIILRNGLGDMIKHLERKGPISDYDVFYRWEAVGEKWNDKNIVKGGITSKRIGINRIKTVAKKFGFKYKILEYTCCNNALELETEWKRKHTDIPKLEKLDGYSEFRAIAL